jgi:hypothetical protein
MQAVSTIPWSERLNEPKIATHGVSRQNIDPVVEENGIRCIVVMYDQVIAQPYFYH